MHRMWGGKHLGMSRLCLRPPTCLTAATQQARSAHTRVLLPSARPRCCWLATAAVLLQLNANSTQGAEPAQWRTISNTGLGRITEAVGCTLSDTSFLLIGGDDGADALSDVWTSSDAARWSRLPQQAGQGLQARTSHAGFCIRDGSSSMVVVAAGRDGPVMGAPIRSVDASLDGGRSWSQISIDDLPGLLYPAYVLVQSNNRLLLIGGEDTDYRVSSQVWASDTLGKTWVLLGENHGWAARRAASATSIRGQGHESVVLAGGIPSDGPAFNDVWRSSDFGESWDVVTQTAPWEGRFSQRAVLLQTILEKEGQSTPTSSVYSTQSTLVIGSGGRKDISRPQVRLVGAAQTVNASITHWYEAKVTTPDTGSCGYALFVNSLNNLVFVGGDDCASRVSDPSARTYGCTAGYSLLWSTGQCLQNECLPGSYGNVSTGCIPCPAGRFGDVPGAGTLDVGCQGQCPPGKWGNLTGQQSARIACPYLCPSGRYGNKTGESSLSSACPGQCPPGTFGNSTGATSEAAGCLMCPPSTFGAVAGAADRRTGCPYSCPPGSFGTVPGCTSEGDACSKCSAGTVTAAPGMTDCIRCTLPLGTVHAGETHCYGCPAGTYRDAQSAACELCSAGKYSEAFEATSPTTCVSCPAGSWSSVPGLNASRGCVLCEVGTFGAVRGASQEQLGCPHKCPMGTFGRAAGQSSEPAACDSCKPGTFGPQEGAKSSDGCIPCQPGTSSDVSGATSASACRPCNPSQVAPAGAASCLQCPGNLVRVRQNSCGCQAGSALTEANLCQRCGQRGLMGIVCDRDGVSAANASLLPGWWRNPTAPLDVNPCLVWPSACPGGNASESCATGHEGVLCSLCVPSFKRRSMLNMFVFLQLPPCIECTDAVKEHTWKYVSVSFCTFLLLTGLIGLVDECRRTPARPNLPTQRTFLVCVGAVFVLLLVVLFATFWDAHAVVLASTAVVASLVLFLLGAIKYAGTHSRCAKRLFRFCSKDMMISVGRLLASEISSVVDSWTTLQQIELYNIAVSNAYEAASDHKATRSTFADQWFFSLVGWLPASTSLHCLLPRELGRWSDAFWVGLIESTCSLILLPMVCVAGSAAAMHCVRRCERVAPPTAGREALVRKAHDRAPDGELKVQVDKGPAEIGAEALPLRGIEGEFHTSEGISHQTIAGRPASKPIAGGFAALVFKLQYGVTMQLCVAAFMMQTFSSTHERHMMYAPYVQVFSAPFAVNMIVSLVSVVLVNCALVCAPLRRRANERSPPPTFQQSSFDLVKGQFLDSLLQGRPWQFAALGFVERVLYLLALTVPATWLPNTVLYPISSCICSLCLGAVTRWLLWSREIEKGLHAQAESDDKRMFIASMATQVFFLLVIYSRVVDDAGRGAAIAAYTCRLVVVPSCFVLAIYAKRKHISAAKHAARHV